MTADVELLPCGECGMPCRPGEYHPYAACLMFKTCRNSDTVRGNLQDAQDHATAAKDAEIETLRSEVERLNSMTAVTMGVGSGDGSLFVHGDYESIKAAQAIVLERDALRAEVERVTCELMDAITRADKLAEALECMIIGACAVAVPHNGERAVLQDAVNTARAALAAYRKGAHQ